MFQALVNWTTAHPVASPADADRLCERLAALPVFTVHATGPDGDRGGALTVVVESGRGLVSFLDIDRGVKLASRDPACEARDIVSLRNDAHPELQLDQIGAQRRDLIPPSRAVAILRHFLLAGEPIGLVPWPPDDWDDRPAAPVQELPQGDDIPF